MIDNVIYSLIGAFCFLAGAFFMSLIFIKFSKTNEPNQVSNFDYEPLTATIRDLINHREDKTSRKKEDDEDEDKNIFFE